MYKWVLLSKWYPAMRWVGTKAALVFRNCLGYSSFPNILLSFFLSFLALEGDVTISYPWFELIRYGHNDFGEDDPTCFH